MSILSRIKKKFAKVEATARRVGRRAIGEVKKEIIRHRRHRHIPKIKIPISPPPGYKKILPIAKRAAPVARAAARVSPVITAAAVGYEAGKQFRKYREKKKRQEMQMLAAEMQRQKQKAKKKIEEKRRVEKLKKMPLDVAFVREQQLKKKREEIKRKSEKKKKAIAEATKKQEAKIREAKAPDVTTVCINNVMATVRRHTKDTYTRRYYKGKLYDIRIMYSQAYPTGRVFDKKPSRNVEQILKGWIEENRELIYIRCKDDGKYYEVQAPVSVAEIKPEVKPPESPEEEPEIILPPETPPEGFETLPPTPTEPPSPDVTLPVEPPEEKKEKEGIPTEYIIAGLFALSMMTKKGEKR